MYDPKEEEEHCFECFVAVRYIIMFVAKRF